MSFCFLRFYYWNILGGNLSVFNVSARNNASKVTSILLHYICANRLKLDF